MAVGPEQADFFPAEGEDVETPFFSEQGKKELQMEAVGDHQGFLEPQGKAEEAEKVRGAENRQTFALVLPEEGILQEFFQGGEQFGGLPFAEPPAEDFFFRAPFQVLETEGILFSHRAHPLGWKVQGHTRTWVRFDETLEVLLRNPFVHRNCLLGRTVFISRVSRSFVPFVRSPSSTRP